MDVAKIQSLLHVFALQNVSKIRQSPSDNLLSFQTFLAGLKKYEKIED
jgi:hypothetical protein